MTAENPNWVACQWTAQGKPFMWRRRKPDETFAAWCVEFLSAAERGGLHLDLDKQEILARARAALGLEAA